MKAELGSTISLKDGKQYRIVRIVDKSYSLFADNKVLEESYIQLKGSDNSVEFVQLDKQESVYDGPPSSIKGLDPLIHKEEQ